MPKREFVIRFQLPTRLSARWLWVFATVGLGVGALAYATVPHTFATGEALSAQKMNENFAALDSRLKALEASSTSLTAVKQTTQSLGTTTTELSALTVTFPGSGTAIVVVNGSCDTDPNKTVSIGTSTDSNPANCPTKCIGNTSSTSGPGATYLIPLSTMGS